MLYILGNLLKTRWLLSNFLNCMLWTPLVNAISLEPYPLSTSNFKFVFILSRGRTLLILGHLLKTKWLPSNFLKCMLWTPLVNGISLESFHQSTLNFLYDVIPYKGRTILILGNLLKSRWPPLTF